MRTPAVVLIVSLAANAALLGLIAIRVSPPAPGSWFGGKLARLTGSVAAPTLARVADRPAGGSQPAALSPKTWSALQANDLPGLVARLRAAGFPPDVVRAIVGDEVQKQFLDRYRQAYEKYGSTTYWKKQELSRDTDLRAISREVNAMMKDLLGSDPVSESNQVFNEVMRRQYGNLSPEKVDKLQAINSDYSDLNNQITHGRQRRDAAGGA